MSSVGRRDKGRIDLKENAETRNEETMVVASGNPKVARTDILPNKSMLLKEEIFHRKKETDVEKRVSALSVERKATKPPSIIRVNRTMGRNRGKEKQDKWPLPNERQCGPNMWPLPLESHYYPLRRVVSQTAAVTRNPSVVRLRSPIHHHQRMLVNE